MRSHLTPEGLCNSKSIRSGHLGREARDESGAILVLALIFMVVSALVVATLLAFSGNDITNSGKLKSGRSAAYAAEGAIQAAMWNMRYTYPSNLAAGFCPATLSWQVNTDPFTPGPDSSSLDGQPIIVWCGATTLEGQSRQLTFYAYPASQCGTGSCSGNAYVQAQVTYNDLGGTDSGSNNGQYKCNSSTTTTCGTGMTVNNWIVLPGLT